MSSDPAASIQARLLNESRRRGEEFERTLTRFGVERFLYRLGASTVRERCLLKGATLLSVWLSDPYRATRDVDLLSFGVKDEESVRTLLEAVLAVPCPDDGLLFDLDHLRVSEIRSAEEYTGFRARFLARLGKARITIQLDLGIGDAVSLPPELVELPTILGALPAPTVRAYPRELSVAEKLEALVKLDTRNSRMKDFHDIWALSGAFAFSGPPLREAVAACFARRDTPLTEEIPRPLTREFYERIDMTGRWTAYLAAGTVLISPPELFEEIGARIVLFLGPVRESIVSGEAFELEWPAGGPWHMALGRSQD